MDWSKSGMLQRSHLQDISWGTTVTRIWIWFALGREFGWGRLLQASTFPCFLNHRSNFKEKKEKEKNHATFFKATLCIQLAWGTYLLKSFRTSLRLQCALQWQHQHFVELNELLECWSYSQHQMQLRNATHILLPQWKCGVACWRKSWSKSSLVTIRQGAYILLWQGAWMKGPL